MRFDDSLRPEADVGAFREGDVEAVPLLVLDRRPLGCHPSVRIVRFGVRKSLRVSQVPDRRRRDDRLVSAAATLLRKDLTP